MPRSGRELTKRKLDQILGRLSKDLEDLFEIRAPFEIDVKKYHECTPANKKLLPNFEHKRIKNYITIMGYVDTARDIIIVTEDSINLLKRAI